MRDLKGTIGTQRAYIRANDDADDLRLQLRKLQRALDVAEAKASKTDSLEVRLQDLQNELDAHKSQGEVFSVDATRLSVCPSQMPPPLPPRPATQTLADGAVVPASTVAPAPPTVASDFDAELLGACRKHHLTGRWRVVARRLKLWRIVQTAHALREHCDAPTPVASPVAEEQPSPASTEEEPSPRPKGGAQLPAALALGLGLVGAVAAQDAAHGHRRRARGARRVGFETVARARGFHIAGAGTRRLLFSKKPRVAGAVPAETTITSCCGVYGESAGTRPRRRCRRGRRPGSRPRSSRPSWRRCPTRSRRARVASIIIAAAVVGGREPGGRRSPARARRRREDRGCPPPRRLRPRCHVCRAAYNR